MRRVWTAAAPLPLPTTATPLAAGGCGSTPAHPRRFAGLARCSRCTGDTWLPCIPILVFSPLGYTKAGVIDRPPVLHDSDPLALLLHSMLCSVVTRPAMPLA